MFTLKVEEQQDYKDHFNQLIPNHNNIGDLLLSELNEFKEKYNTISEQD